MLRSSLPRRAVAKIAVRGREDRKLMAPEYISPQQQAPHSLWKRLVRQDCLRRRNIIDLPEFYPGSILSVSYSDKNAPDKKLRFVGRCLNVTGFGTNHKMVLRNIVDDVAVNIRFDLYSPLIHQVQVLKLEKWLDNDLTWMIKFADPEYCRIPFSMMPEIIPPQDEKLKLFDGKVMLKPMERDVIPATTTQEYKDWGDTDSGWTPEKKTRRFFAGRKRNEQFVRKGKLLSYRWPPVQNLFLEEDMITEDEIVAEYKHRDKNWQEYDIMRHHNYDDEHDEIIEQMTRNAKLVPRITKTIGRPKVDYSKISKVWVENHTPVNCRSLSPEYTD